MLLRHLYFFCTYCDDDSIIVTSHESSTPSCNQRQERSFRGNVFPRLDTSESDEYTLVIVINDDSWTLLWPKMGKKSKVSTCIDTSEFDVTLDQNFPDY